VSCPSDLVLDDIVAGTRPRDAHVEGCASCQERLARFERTAQAARPRVAALLARAEAPHAERRRASWRWWSLGATLAAAMAVLVVVARPVDEVRVKGSGVAVQLFRQRAGEVMKVDSNDDFRPGDALRFVVDAARPIDYALAEVESGGKIVVHQRGKLEAGRTALPGSLVLDDSRGSEWFVLVTDAKDPLAAVRAHRGTWLEIRK
jgi:hypothetical protein